MILSFAWTLSVYLQGLKTVTRRDWADRTLKMWQKAFDEGRLTHRAWDKLPCWGGECVGEIKLTQRPYRERLSDITQAEVTMEAVWYSDPLVNSPQVYIEFMVDKHGEEIRDKELVVVHFEPLPFNEEEDT